MMRTSRMMDYNSRLKPMDRKGKCGDQEFITSSTQLQLQVTELAEYLHRSKYSVVFTGAGISTAYPASIPDFRGPNGVWTRELQGDLLSSEEKTPKLFNQAKPTFSHRAIFHLLNEGYIHHVISQNVDGLHLRSGVPMDKLSEIHGNIFMEICEKCHRRYFRDYDVGGMGLKYTGNRCDEKTCNGKLRDFAIDWDTDLPEDILKRAKDEVLKADLVICLGTSLRIRPAGNMPAMVLKPHKLRNQRRGKLVIVNLQETHLNDRANLVIYHYADEVMKLLCQKLGIAIATETNSEIQVPRKDDSRINTSQIDSTRSAPTDDIVITYDSEAPLPPREEKPDYFFREEVEERKQRGRRKKVRTIEKVDLLIEQCLSEAAKDDDEEIQIVHASAWSREKSGSNPSSSSSRTAVVKKERNLANEIANLLEQDIFVNRVKYSKFFVWQKATQEKVEEAQCTQLFAEYVATSPIGDIFSHRSGYCLTFVDYSQQFEEQLLELQTRLVEYMQSSLADSQLFPDYVQKLADKISLERHLKEMRELL